MEHLFAPFGKLLELLRRPESAAELSLAEWDIVVRQARSAALLARLEAVLADGGALELVPMQPRRHLAWSAVAARKHAHDVAWEVSYIRQALASASLPVILLKGAAYLMAGLPPARGRLFTDLDILAPGHLLPQVERALMMHGWINEPMADYDRRYYRTWMHELPPMRHAVRGTVIDVHHTILPRTARPRIDADAIIAAAEPIADGGMRVLAPEDMTLHMIVHAFYDGDLSQGLRDLVDVDSLLRHFGRDASFWSRLEARATRFGLLRPLWYALRFSHAALGTPAPAAMLSERAAGAPAWALRVAMDAAAGRALRPRHPSCDGAAARACRFALYVRSHYLRMPPGLLLRHLARKTAMRLREPRAVHR
jgi:hypothetical protein